MGRKMSDFLVRIYYEDTDCGGIVYHTNYIKYCERARSEIFFSAGILPNTERIGLVVRKLNADFLDSAKLGDLLVVKTRIVKLGQTSLTLNQEIYHADKSTKIFQCEVKLACIDIKHKKIVKIPNDILAILKTKF